MKYRRLPFLKIRGGETVEREVKIVRLVGNDKYLY